MEGKVRECQGGKGFNDEVGLQIIFGFFLTFCMHWVTYFQCPVCGHSMLDNRLFLFVSVEGYLLCRDRADISVLS